MVVSTVSTSSSTDGTARHTDSVEVGFDTPLIIASRFSDLSESHRPHHNLSDMGEAP
jgi:hypothetical protein